MIQSMHVLCFITTHSEFVNLIINDYDDDEDDCIQSLVIYHWLVDILKIIVGCKPVAIFTSELIS